MKKSLLLILFLMFSILGQSQIEYQKGYIISSNNEKTDCFIKNLDWKNNPTEIKYKIAETDDYKMGNLQTIKEFVVFDECKFVNATVQLDKSSDNVGNLTTVGAPVFTEENMFLKVILEGKATLYQYQSSNLIRFFYSTETVSFEPLVYKRFYTSLQGVGRNESYKDVLKTNLKCDNVTVRNIEDLDYELDSLTKIFMKYNDCFGTSTLKTASGLTKNSKTYNSNDAKRDTFNLTPRIGVNFSNLELTSNTFPNDAVNYGATTSIRFGLETEFILPYNKNKFALIAEIVYFSYKSELQSGTKTLKVDYAGLDIPFGLRYFFFLNKDNKIFINGSYVLNFNSKDRIETKRFDGTIKNKGNLAFGLGYKLKNKISVEFRLATTRNATDLINYDLNYNQNSFILGYSFL